MSLGEMGYEIVNYIHLVNMAVKLPSSMKGKEFHDVDGRLFSPPGGFCSMELEIPCS
jgi:hypothetical protein